MIRVVFVCLGNICRSPMAEAIFRNLVQKEGLEGKFIIDSAGTGDWHIGHPPHEGTREILDAQKISYEGLQARQVNKEDLKTFDYIIAMDAKNVGDLHRMARNEKTGYIGRLLDFVDESDIEDVPDPYFTDNFEEVLHLVTEGCTKLLEYIRTEKEL
jgi:protein-tyrosine phosphatase